jgi:tubulin alpha
MKLNSFTLQMRHRLADNRDCSGLQDLFIFYTFQESFGGRMGSGSGSSGALVYPSHAPTLANSVMEPYNSVLTSVTTHTLEDSERSFMVRYERVLILRS